MRLFFILLILFLFSKIVHSSELFHTNEYVLQFESNNITLDKKIKINEIKIKSFQFILAKILTKEDFTKINTTDILFINNFILNLKINNEKIINNRYFSNISINYNSQLIIDYLIQNNIDFVDHLPSRFLIVILEQDGFKNVLLSNENNFYKFLLSNKDQYDTDFFLTPNLDHNDRYLFNKENFLNDKFIKNNQLNYKYETKYQILVHSIKEQGHYNYKVFLLYNNIKYLVLQNKKNFLNYEKFFNQIKIASLDKWKQLNKINTSTISQLECKISINNISEIKYVRNKLENNSMVKNFFLKTIKLNENIYRILFYGNINIFSYSLERDRLRLFANSTSCIIELI
jgi:hypothetical protein